VGHHAHNLFGSLGFQQEASIDKKLLATCNECVQAGI